MKYIIQIPIILLMLWASGKSYASHCVALSSGDIEAYVTKACSENDASGAINLVISGGIGFYDILYKDAFGNIIYWASVEETTGPDIIGDEDLSGLLPGTYTVRVIDSRCAMAEVEVEVGVNSSTILMEEDVIWEVSNACSSSSADGSIDITINGGTGPYIVTWYKFTIPYGQFGGLPFLLQEAQVFSNSGPEDLMGVKPGIYYVRITDSNCGSIIIKFNIEVKLKIIQPFEDYICDNATGMITPKIEGGESPYAFMWSNGQTGATATNLTPGNYSVTITDNSGCSAKKTYNILLSNITYDLRKKSKVCDDNDLAYIKIENISGGKSPFTVKWSDGQQGAKIENLGVGNYKFTITDAADCSKTGNTDILSNNSGINPPIISNSNSCKCNGSIQVMFYGTTFGSGLWYKENEIYRTKKTNIDQSIYNLCPGIYRFVSDNFECPIDEIITVKEEQCSTKIQLVALKNSCGCPSGSLCNGLISVAITNPPAGQGLFKWYKDDSYFSEGETLKNLCSGKYKVEYYHPDFQYPIVETFTIQDIDCTSELESTVVLESIQNASDCNSADGLINIESSIQNLSYKWSTGATTQDINNLSQGIYEVTVSKDCFNKVMKFDVCTCNDCDIYDYGVFVQTLSTASCGYSEIKGSVTNATSAFDNDGAIEIQTSTTNPHQIFKWVGPNGFISREQNISGLFPGKYTLNFSDGCSEIIKEFLVVNKDYCNINPIMIEYEKKCLSETYTGDGTLVKNSRNQGLLRIKASGGNLPYQYKWNTGAITPEISINRQGYYEVTITDKTGCSAYKFFNMELMQYHVDGLNSVAAIGPYVVEYPLGTYRLCEDTHENSDAAFVSLRILGGSSPVKIKWHDGSVNEVFLNLKDAASNLKWGQVSQMFFNLKKDELFRWSAEIIDDCYCGEENNVPFGNCDVGNQTIGGLLACTKKDENGNLVPCEVKIETEGLTGDICDVCDWGDIFWAPNCAKAEFKNVAGDNSISYYMGFFPKSGNAEIWNNNTLEFKVYQPGVYYALAEELVNGKFTGCRQGYRIEYDICDDPIIQIDNPNNSDCPNFSGDPTVEDNDTDLLEFDIAMEKLPDAGTEAKILIKNDQGGEIMYISEMQISNGSNIFEISKDDIGYVSGSKDYTVDILLPKFLTDCPKPLQFNFRLNGKECPKEMTVSFEEETMEGKVTIFSPINLSNCRLQLPGNINLSVDLDIGENEIPFSLGNLQPGSYSIKFLFPFPNDEKCNIKPKSIRISGTPCINTIIVDANKPENKLRVTINSPADIENCRIKFFKFDVLKKEKEITIKNGNVIYNFDDVIKSFTAGSYKCEVSFGNLGCQRVNGYFVIDPPKDECGVKYTFKDFGTTIKGTTVIFRYEKKFGLRVSGHFTIVDSNNKTFKEGTFNLLTDNMNGTLEITPITGLPSGTYTCTLYHDDPLECTQETFKFGISNIIDDDPPASFMTCTDNIIEVIYDPLSDDYKFFWGNEQPDSKLLLGHNFSSLNLEGNIKNYSALNIDPSLIKNIRIDANKNHMITSIDGTGRIDIEKLNNKSNTIWSSSITNKIFKSQSDGLNGQHDFLVFDPVQYNYQKINISSNGYLSQPQVLNIPVRPFSYMKILPQGVIASTYQPSGLQITLFPFNGQPSTLEFDKKIRIKDIKSTPSGQILIASEFKGEININGVNYNSEGFNNALFIQMDNEANVLNIKSDQSYRDEYIATMASDGKTDLSYSGKYVERDYYSNAPFLPETDSCTFIKLIQISDTSCTLLPPALTLDETACKLSVSSPEPDVIYTLHEDADGVWQEVNGAVFLYQPESNGRYRASAKKEGCTTAFSDITEVNCLKIPLPCEVNLLDLTYDTLADKFAWYWGETKFGLDSIFGNTIDKTLITSTITTFVKYQISYTWVKHIRYDILGNIYIFGTDGTTKSFVTTITTSGVTTTTWYQDVILHDIIWLPVLYQYSLLMYDKILNQYTHQIRRLTGQLISTENLGDFQSGKYSFEMLQYHKTDYYTNVEYSSAQTRIRWYMGPTTYVTNLPPAVRIKRIQKWSQDRWMVSTEYTGTIIINGTTYTSIGYNTVMFIWYDGQGNVIKVTEIKHSRDEFISHVSTDGFKKVVYTGIYRDTIYNSTYPNGYIIEECAFMDGFDVEFNTPAPIAVPTSSKKDRVPKSSQEFRFYPNPFSKGINLDITSDIAEEVNIETYNMVGAMMFTTKLDLQQGQNVRYMEAFERIPAGVYMVKIKSTTREHMTRVIRIE